MASRQEEKQRRREERLARERAAAAAAKRRKMLQIAAGVVVVAAVAVGVAVAAGGGKDKQAKADPAPAAKAAGCVLERPQVEGADHVTTKVDYKTNPPTSGDHVPPGEQASDGSYVGVKSPAKERYVHSLEHGRVIIHYRPGLPQPQIRQLEALFAEDSETDFGLDSIGGGFTLLMRNNTGMPFDVAATAWGHLLACKTFDPKVIDAVRVFRRAYILQAPEKVTAPE